MSHMEERPGKRKPSVIFLERGTVNHTNTKLKDNAGETSERQSRAYRYHPELKQTKMVSNQSCDLNFNGNWWRIRSQSFDSLNTDHNHFRVSTVGRATTDNTALRHSQIDICGDMLAGQQGFTVSWIPVVACWPTDDKGSQAAEYLWCHVGQPTRVHRQLNTCGVMLASRQGFTGSWIPVVTCWPADKGSQAAGWIPVVTHWPADKGSQAAGYLRCHTSQPMYQLNLLFED